MLGVWLKLLRPKHWIKNLLVAAPILFAFTFTAYHIGRVLVAIAGFCLISSAIYVINDIADRESDRHHPKKKFRPIAAGKIKVAQARVVAAGLLVVGLGSMAFLNWQTVVVGAFYVVLNLFYSKILKHIAIVDVMVIALGFVLRVIAGAAAIWIPVSHWILLTTFFGALFLAFGKRKNEMSVLSDKRKAHRQSSAEYTDRFIDQMLALTSAVVVVFYAFYTIDADTVKHFGSQWLIYTTPLVVFGVLRYYYLLYNREEGGDPVQLLLTDVPLIVAVFIWLVSVVGIYAHGNHILI